jgi:serine/threonine-protein kinase
VKVADFGLSRVIHPDQQPLNLTQSGVTMGTPLYMSPEQVNGGELDARSDIYSFGVTCYHMLAGQPPYKGTSPFDVAVQHVQGTPAPLQSIRPDLPAELCASFTR